MADVAGLIQHLRSLPNPGNADVPGLAARFQVDESVVRSALQTLSRTVVRTEAARKDRTHPAWNIYEWIQARPAVAILICGAVILAFLLLSDVFSRPLSLIFIWLTLAGVFAALIAAALSRRARFGLLVGPVISAALLMETAVSNKGKIAAPALFGFSLIGVLISVVGVLFAVIGSFIWLKREQRTERKLTRQQMLDRLLRVREALANPATALPPTPWQQAIAAVRRNFWVSCLGTAVFMAAVQTLLFWILKPTPAMFTPQTTAASLDARTLAVAGIMALVGFGQFLLILGIGYLARTILRSLGATAIQLAVSVVPALLGLNPGNWERLQNMPILQIVLTYIMFFACGIIGVGAAAVEDYTQRARLRRENDPEALLAELVELEIALGGGQQETYVLVVDVAGSTAMKKDCDPLVAEWTFRAYQELVAQLCGRHAGRVESTAGDGAVLGFPSAEQALAAARELLAALPDFNRTTNRLPQDFVLRIGLHCGSVQGGLQEVQFTRVIDVAAHVEAASPRNGIGMTSAFREKLPPETPAQKMAAAVDGFDVYVLA